jgi:dihydrodiol dehydrogenase / D-xylose 1-dehydrogenase (NADP)
VKIIRWGIISTGNIASQFAKACAFESSRTGKSVLSAVASRNAEKAAEFALKWNIARSYASYEALFADPDIDAVYIGTPHNSHAELSIQALNTGKAVLCEKPVSLTLEELLPVVETARKQNVFFMEAMWMKFNPSFRKALSWAEEGRIGKVQYIRSDFFLNSTFNPEGRLYNPALGGGALLDVGIYPVTCAAMFAGRQTPERISSIIHPASTGVDLYTKAHLTWDSGVFADLSSAINLPGIEPLRSAVIMGESGSIVLPFFWMAQNAYILDNQGTEIESFKAPFECNGYEYEIREVESCLLEGNTESSVQTWADSIMVMDILDTIRMVARNE